MSTITKNARESFTNSLTIYDYLLRGALAISILGGPLTFLAYSLLNPLVRGDGTSMIAVNQAANSLTNQLHLAFGVLASFLLPLGYIGMSMLAMQGARKLGIVAFLFALPSWTPLSALIALDALSYDMAHMRGGVQFAQLWDTFNMDGLMATYLITYAICHMVCTILLGVGLGKSGIIPGWAAWALIISSPLTIVGFITHQILLLNFVLVLLSAGSFPAALAVLKLPAKASLEVIPSVS